MERMELENFTYKSLYNGYSRGGVYKNWYEPLLAECVSKEVLKIEKYRVQKDVEIQVFWDIEERKGRKYHRFKEILKDYHQENDGLIVPFIYLL